MDFIKKLLENYLHKGNTEGLPRQSELTSKDFSEDSPSDKFVSPEPVNLLSRLFGSRKSPLDEPPEIEYENEAWAPEHQSVGLFHKHRNHVQNPTSSSSDSQ